MSFEKVLFCFALVGSAGFSFVLAALLVYWSKLKIQSFFEPETDSSKGNDEALTRALKLIEDLTLATEALKDTTTALQQRVDLAEAAVAAKASADSAEQGSPVPAAAAKPTRRRTTKAAPAAPLAGDGYPSTPLPSLEELTGMSSGPTSGEQFYHERPVTHVSAEEKFDVIA